MQKKFERGEDNITGLLETGPEGLTLAWATVSRPFFCPATAHYTLNTLFAEILHKLYTQCPIHRNTIHILLSGLRSYIQTMFTTRIHSTL